MESIWNPIIYVRFTRLDQGQKVAYISTFLGSLFELLKRCQRVVNRSSTFINHLSAICWHWTAVRQLSDSWATERFANVLPLSQYRLHVMSSPISPAIFRMYSWPGSTMLRDRNRCKSAEVPWLSTQQFIYIYICFIYSLYMFIFYNIIYASWTFQVCIESIGMPIVFNSKKEAVTAASITCGKLGT